MFDVLKVAVNESSGNCLLTEAARVVLKSLVFSQLFPS